MLEVSSKVGGNEKVGPKSLGIFSLRYSPESNKAVVKRVRTTRPN